MVIWRDGRHSEHHSGTKRAGSVIATIIIDRQAQSQAKKAHCHQELIQHIHTMSTFNTTFGPGSAARVQQAPCFTCLLCQHCGNNLQVAVVANTLLAHQAQIHITVRPVHSLRLMSVPFISESISIRSQSLTFTSRTSSLPTAEDPVALRDADGDVVMTGT